MAKREDTTYFEKKLLEFVGTKDPMLEMLQWVMDKFMEIEVSQKTGAEKGERTENEPDTEAGTESDGLTPDWEQCTCRYLKSGREDIYRFL